MEEWLLPPDDDGSEDEDDGDGDGEADDDGDNGMVWESLDDEDDDGRSAPITLGVLPSNLRTVEVFQRCQPQVALGMGVLWQGVSAAEVRAACLMSHVPRAEWPRLIKGVQFMALTVADVRNENEAAKARNRRA